GKGGRGARAWARDRFVEAGDIFVDPYFVAGRSVVTNHRFFLAPLLLGINAVAHHEQRRPGRADGTLPNQDRRIVRPVGGDEGTQNDSIPIRTTKVRPIAGGWAGQRQRVRRSRRG